MFWALMVFFVCNILARIWKIVANLTVHDLNTNEKVAAILSSLFWIICSVVFLVLLPLTR